MSQLRSFYGLLVTLRVGKSEFCRTCQVLVQQLSRPRHRFGVLNFHGKSLFLENHMSALALVKLSLAHCVAIFKVQGFKNVARNVFAYAFYHWPSGGKDKNVGVLLDFRLSFHWHQQKTSHVTSCWMARSTKVTRFKGSRIKLVTLHVTLWSVCKAIHVLGQV